MAISGWQLLAQQGPRAGQSFDLNKPVITIGREASNDIVLEDPQVSRHHARLTLQGAGYVIEDLGSTNGTFINGQRVMGARPINDGDTLGLGDTVVLKVMGAAGAGETVVGAGQPQTMAASFGAPPPPSTYSPPPPPPPSTFGPPPPPPPSGYGAPQPEFGAPPPPLPPKRGSRWWLWGCGCLLLLCIILTVVLVYLYFNPGPANEIFKLLGIPVTFQ